jgi:hypothetical protein
MIGTHGPLSVCPLRKSAPNWVTVTHLDYNRISPEEKPQPGLAPNREMKLGVSPVPVSVYFSVRSQNRQSAHDDILCEAGRPGDRWASLRKKAGREESPDTVVFAFCAGDESLQWKTPQTKGQRAW